MNPIELKKMGLTPLGDSEAVQINGGDGIAWYKKFAFGVGFVLGVTVKVTRNIAEKILATELTR